MSSLSPRTPELSLPTLLENLRALEERLIAPVAPDKIWRARIAVRLAAALAPFGLLYGLVFATIGLTGLATSLVLACFVVGGSPWVIRWTGSVQLGGHVLTAGLVQSLLGPTWYFGGLNAACLPWFALCTTVATVVSGRSAGLVWSGVNLLVVAVLYGAWLWGLLPEPSVGPETTWFLMAITHAGFFVITGGALIGATAAIDRQRMALERARAGAQLANRTKSDFLASMSHELRTPMNAILGYAEMLEEDVGPAQQDDLARIHDAGTHLLGLINDVLDLSKVEAGQMRFEVQPVEVLPLVRKVLDQASPLLAANRNTAAVEGRELMVLADPVRLTQCMLNLVANAAKFTHDGTVVILVTEEQRQIVISVADSGEGMDSEQLARVFEPFVQVHEGRAGTGLGLAIVREFLTRMGGSVVANSRLGRGSTFTVRLPSV